MWFLPIMFLVGKVITTCLAQGGQQPVWFGAAIADYLVNDEVRSKTCIRAVNQC